MNVYSSANTQMDNDVTPVYLAAQVIIPQQSISPISMYLLPQEGHLDVLKFLVEAGGSLYVSIKLHYYNCFITKI